MASISMSSSTRLRLPAISRHRDRRIPLESPNHGPDPGSPTASHGAILAPCNESQHSCEVGFPSIDPGAGSRGAGPPGVVTEIAVFLPLTLLRLAERSVNTSRLLATSTPSFYPPRMTFCLKLLNRNACHSGDH
jgi:hypothetical protein